MARWKKEQLEVGISATPSSRVVISSTTCAQVLGGALRIDRKEKKNNQFETDFCELQLLFPPLLNRMLLMQGFFWKL